MLKWIHWVRAAWWEVHLLQSRKLCLLFAQPSTLCMGSVFFHTHANSDALAPPLPAFEERLPRWSKLGPRLKRAPDGSLRRHDLWRRCGRLSSEGAGGAEGGAERAERWHQPHHPGKQRLDHHTQQPQPQCISDSPRASHVSSRPLPSSPSSSPRFSTALCGGDPIRWRPLHIVRAYYIYPNFCLCVTSTYAKENKWVIIQKLWVYVKVRVGACVLLICYT